MSKFIEQAKDVDQSHVLDGPAWRFEQHGVRKEDGCRLRARDRHVDPVEREEKGDVAGHLLAARSEEHTSELQSLMRISYAVFCLQKSTNAIETTRLHSHTAS